MKIGAPSILFLYLSLLFLYSVNGARLVRQEKLNNEGLTIQDQQIMFLEKLRENTQCDESQNTCFNGGQCVEKQCYCRSPYIGPYCQYQLDIDPYINFWLAVGICAFCLVFGCIVTYFISQCMQERQRQYNLLYGEGYTVHEIWDKSKKEMENNNTDY